MKYDVFRLHCGDDLRLSLEQYAREKNIGAAVIVSCVGCLLKARLRDASGANVRELRGRYEIVSATGTLGDGRLHVHVSLAGEDMAVIGGHLCAGCIVNTTAEIVLLRLDGVRFRRRFDPDTGYDELDVEPALPES